LGGKWTTSRQVAKTITDAAVKWLGIAAKPCVTAETPLPGGRFEDWEQLVKCHEQRWPGVPGIRHLSHMFGARLPEIMNVAEFGDLVPVGISGDTELQIEFAVREEMAVTLEDVVMRRTSLGQFGPLPGLEKIAERIGALLGWDRAREAREVASLALLYRTSEAA